jgi:CRISPR-associated endonuclease/helicase Cas3
VLRRRDLLSLFDTAPDLSGNDIDVSPFIRDTVDRTVHLAWREIPEGTPMEGAAPGGDELCPAPINDVRKMIIEGRTRARVFDQMAGKWVAARPEDVRPTAVIVFDATRGGYLPERGFAPNSTAPVEPMQPHPQEPDAVDTDPHSMLSGGRWVTLHEHLADVERECRALLGTLAPQLTAETRRIHA